MAFCSMMLLPSERLGLTRKKRWLTKSAGSNVHGCLGQLSEPSLSAVLNSLIYDHSLTYIPAISQLYFRWTRMLTNQVPFH